MALDILACYEQEPPPIDMVLPGLLPGTVGSIIAPGGVGKSYLAMELAHLVATGKDLAGVSGENGVSTGPVAYLNAEDPENILHHRLHAMGQYLDPNIRDAANEKLLVETLLGHAPDLLDPAWERSITDFAQDKRLVILDTLSRFHSVVENDEASAKSVLRVLERIAGNSGAAIVFCHHANKLAIREGTGDSQAASRGSSVWTDEVRWQVNQTVMRKDEADKWRYIDGSEIPEEKCKMFVCLSGSKQNYSPDLMEDYWMQRMQGGILRPAAIVPAKQQGNSDGNKGRRDHA